MKFSGNKFLILIILALAAGLFIGWVDTLPNWDDTGITALLIFVSSFIIGLLANDRIWVFALIIGLCVLCFNILLHNNYGSVFGFVFSFFGAYAGYYLKKIVKQ